MPNLINTAQPTGQVMNDFRRARTSQLVPGRGQQRAQRNYLQALTADKCAELYNALRKGQLSDVMIAWDELEEFDDILSTVADKRAAGLAECEASILPDSAMIGTNEELRALADQQQAFLVHYMSRIVNMEEAVAHLGSASFRGFAHLYKHQHRNGSMQLVVFPQWYFSRPAGTGYLLNPSAVASSMDLYELDPSKWICREVRRPIDLVAMFACMVKYSAEQGNASFLDVFGNPSIFFEYPPGTSDERAREYDAIVNAIISDGRGGFPAGGKITTVESNANSGQSFLDFATWANKKIVRKGLGGELTLLSESGSGTLAGGAHEDGLISLYKADAKSIAGVLHEQLFKPAIQEAFPGAPVLVRYKLDYPQQYDIAVETTAIATLVNAGYEPSTEQVKERTGYDCKKVASAAAQGMNMGTPPAWQSGGMSNRAALMNRDEEEGGEDEPPLTPQEEEDFAKLGHVDIGFLDRVQKGVQRQLEAAAGALRPETRQNAPESADKRLAGTFTENRQNTPAQPLHSRQNGKSDARASVGGRFVGYLRRIFNMSGAAHECKATVRPCPLSTVSAEEAKPIVKKYKDEKMKDAQKHAKEVLPREVSTPLKDAPTAALNGSDIKEMLNTKAVYASARNGVSPEVHEEAVLRTPELIKDAKEVSRRPGGKKDRVEIKDGKEVRKEDPIEEIIEMDADFSAEDGERYTARYSVQKYKKPGMKPKIYFMYCKKPE